MSLRGDFLLQWHPKAPSRNRNNFNQKCLLKHGFNPYES